MSHIRNIDGLISQKVILGFVLFSSLQDLWSTGYLIVKINMELSQPVKPSKKDLNKHHFVHNVSGALFSGVTPTFLDFTPALDQIALATDLLI